jgi:hypothetical protein
MDIEADFRRVLDPAELRALRRPGRTTLNQALRRHTPELAKTKSQLERAFRALCSRGGIPPYNEAEAVLADLWAALERAA